MGEGGTAREAGARDIVRTFPDDWVDRIVTREDAPVVVYQAPVPQARVPPTHIARERLLCAHAYRERGLAQLPSPQAHAADVVDKLVTDKRIRALRGNRRPTRRAHSLAEKR